MEDSTMPMQDTAIEKFVCPKLVLFHLQPSYSMVTGI